MSAPVPLPQRLAAAREFLAQLKSEGRLEAAQVQQRYVDALEQQLANVVSWQSQDLA